MSFSRHASSQLDHGRCPSKVHERLNSRAMLDTSAFMQAYRNGVHIQQRQCGMRRQLSITLMVHGRMSRQDVSAVLYSRQSLSRQLWKSTNNPHLVHQCAPLFRGAAHRRVQPWRRRPCRAPAAAPSCAGPLNPQSRGPALLHMSLMCRNPTTCIRAYMEHLNMYALTWVPNSVKCADLSQLLLPQCDGIHKLPCTLIDSNCQKICPHSRR